MNSFAGVAANGRTVVSPRVATVTISSSPGPTPVVITRLRPSGDITASWIAPPGRLMIVVAESLPSDSCHATVGAFRSGKNTRFPSGVHSYDRRGGPSGDDVRSVTSYITSPYRPREVEPMSTRRPSGDSRGWLNVVLVDARG